MKEELIQFTTAKLAKEKGFSLKDTDGVYFWRKGDINTLLRDTDCLFDAYWEIGYEESDGDLLRPTQSLLQKWLREERGIKVFITWTSLTQWVYEVVDPCGGTGGFKTYEQALEAGLQEALKLI